jgi:aspartyl-tRNA(Asn)/glutamyl-tRNA(Gln) amidotransferase subunit A
VTGGLLWQLGAVEAAAAVRDGSVTPVDLLASALERIDAVEPTLRAFVEVDRDGAARDAAELSREAEAGALRGPLHGVPVAIKDIFDVVGLPTRCGSPVYDGAPPAAADAAVVARLREAGALIVGKTVTHELACGVYSAPTRNPWDPALCCGGSSGGSGAAVAAGAVAGATGSDTGGSIRIPSALCGIVGIKPTYDLLSRQGVAALAWTLDTVGPLARSVEDAALMLEAMLGAPARARVGTVWPIPTVELAGLVIGVPADGILTLVEPPVAAAFDAFRAQLERAGARVVAVSIPELEETLPIEFAIVMAEAASYHEAALRLDDPPISDGIRTLFRAGAVLPARDYLLAQRLRAGICRALDRCFEDNALDALCAPTLPLAGYGHDDTTLLVDGAEEAIADGTVRTTAPFNLTGSPVVSLPAGLTDAGLPVGVQFVGRAFDDARLVAIAAAYEGVRDSGALDAAHPIRRQTL